ncbi:MAG: hypothetical protein WAV22_11265 [Porticoccaceae bacterium]
MASTAPKEGNGTGAKNFRRWLKRIFAGRTIVLVFRKPCGKTDTGATKGRRITPAMTLGYPEIFRSNAESPLKTVFITIRKLWHRRGDQPRPST